MKNLIGNALTVLILLMSCFFFAAALMVGAAQRNWKAEVAQLTTRAEAAERQVNDAKNGAKDQLMAIQREKVSRAQQIANLFSQKRILTDMASCANVQFCINCIIWVCEFRYRHNFSRTDKFTYTRVRSRDYIVPKASV